MPDTDAAARMRAAAWTVSPNRRRARGAGLAVWLVAAGPILANGAALAQAPPLPNSVGPGSLPSVRAAAAAERIVGQGESLSASPGGPVAQSDIRLGGFGFPLASPLSGTGPSPGIGEVRRPFSITPSLGVQLLGTDNLFQTSTNRRADLVTTISPGVLLTADTARLQGVLNYAPNVLVYARTGEQNRFDQLGTGQALATLIPGLLYLDLRGASAVQSITGGIAPESGLVTQRNNRVSTIAAQVSPYLLYEFGTLATLQAGYSFHFADQTGTASQLGTTGLVAGRPAFTSQNFTAHEGYGILRSGPDFRRLAWEARLDSTSYIGNGVLDGAFRRQASIEGRYAIVRGIWALAEVGYEQQRYGGTPGLRIDGPVWALGGRLDSPDGGRIIAKYGRRDGFESANLDASIPIGGRTRLAASYSERLTTSAQRAVDLLTSSSIDAQGNPIDLATGQPTVRSFASSFLGAQGNLLRVRSATASVVQTWPRDIIVLSIIQEQRSPVSVGFGSAGFSQRGISGSVTWAHALSERSNVTAFVQYGQFNTAVLGQGELVSGSLTLSRQLAPRVVGALQIASSSRTSGNAAGRATQNIALVSLRQIF